MMMEDTSNVANFVIKLWKMLNNKATLDIMTWGPNGKSFVIKDQLKFISKLLPMYFKHNNMGSFVRQLNLYDFHKICIDRTMELEYYHKFFQKDRSDLLKFIKRKLPKLKKTHYTKGEKEELGNISKEMTVIKTQQDIMGKQLTGLQKQNTALLKEISNLYTKHNTQTEILRKIIEMLIPFMDTYSSATTQEATTKKYLENNRNITQKINEINNTGLKETTITQLALEGGDGDNNNNDNNNENRYQIRSVPTTPPINDFPIMSLEDFNSLVKHENPAITFDEDDYFSEICDDDNSNDVIMVENPEIDINNNSSNNDSSPSTVASDNGTIRETLNHLNNDLSHLFGGIIEDYEVLDNCGDDNDNKNNVEKN